MDPETAARHAEKALEPRRLSGPAFRKIMKKGESALRALSRIMRPVRASGFFPPRFSHCTWPDSDQEPVRSAYTKKPSSCSPPI